MRKRKTSPKKPKGRRPQDIDAEARALERELAAVDLESLESGVFEVDPLGRGGAPRRLAPSCSPIVSPKQGHDLGAR